MQPKPNYDHHYLYHNYYQLKTKKKYERDVKMSRKVWKLFKRTSEESQIKESIVEKNYRGRIFTTGNFWILEVRKMIGQR